MWNVKVELSFQVFFCTLLQIPCTCDILTKADSDVLKEPTTNEQSELLQWFFLSELLFWKVIEGWLQPLRHDQVTHVGFYAGNFHFCLNWPDPTNNIFYYVSSW